MYRRDGREETIECDGVLSTLPLPQLVEHDDAGAAADGRASTRRKLRYRSLKLIYIALKRPQLTDYHWVYLLDEQFRVNRMSEQKNVSAEMVPADRTILCIELSLLARRAGVAGERRGDLPHRAARPDEDGLRRHREPRSRTTTSPTSRRRIRCTS